MALADSLNRLAAFLHEQGVRADDIAITTMSDPVWPNFWQATVDGETVLRATLVGCVDLRRALRGREGSA
jgi:hypothetical protein